MLASPLWGQPDPENDSIVTCSNITRGSDNKTISLYVTKFNYIRVSVCANPGKSNVDDQRYTLKVCRAENSSAVEDCVRNHTIDRNVVVLTLNTTTGETLLRLMQTARSLARAYLFLGDDSTFADLQTDRQIPVLLSCTISTSRSFSELMTRTARSSMKRIWERQTTRCVIIWPTTVPW